MEEYTFLNMMRKQNRPMNYNFYQCNAFKEQKLGIEENLDILFAFCRISLPVLGTVILQKNTKTPAASVLMQILLVEL